MIDGLPLRAGHEVTVYHPVFSAAVSGVLDRDHDVGGVPLAAETRVVLQDEAREPSSGTLREAATIGGVPLAAGTCSSCSATRCIKHVRRLVDEAFALAQAPFEDALDTKLCRATNPRLTPPDGRS